jgi:hypothetical protein
VKVSRRISQGESRKLNRAMLRRFVLTWRVSGVRDDTDEDDGVLWESRLGVLWRALWKMCFLMESPMERQADDDLSRWRNCSGVPEGRRFSGGGDREKLGLVEEI